MHRLVPLLLLALASLAAAATPIPFPHTGSDLAPDPEARFGTLPNGFRYVVRANREPKDRASLRLLVEAGALHETEKQLGLAHFLEHMAFNGTTHYGPDELIKFFQRMGMSFGSDTNASTWYHRTLYLLELPDTKTATLAEGMKVFNDYAGGILLLEKEIEKERGIILSEKRTRDSVGYRTWLATNNFLLQGTLFSRRDVIGTEQSLSTMPRPEFVDYYDTWYRPELMSVVVVGDIDPAAVEKMLVDTFSPLKSRAPARPQPDLGQLRRLEGVEAFHHFEAEAPDTNVTLATLVPYSPQPDTAANRLAKLPRTLAHAMLNRRLSELAKKEGAPFTRASSGVGEAFNFYRQSTLSVTCRADQWQAALGVADQELRRALEHGFQQPELDEVRATFRNSLEQAVKTAATRRSAGLADEFAEALLDREVVTTPDADLALYGPALEKVDLAACAAALRAAWSAPHRLVLVTGNAPVPGADGPQRLAAIRAAYEKSRAVAVAAPAVIAQAAWAYTDFGPPGKVARRRHVEDLDVHLLEFENGVRLNLKKTDFEANRIRVNVRLGNGQLTEPRDRPGLSFYTNQTLQLGGLGRHSSDDLRRILAGRTVGASVGASSDAFVISGATNPRDLLLQLQLVAAGIVDPGFRPEAARQIRKAIDEMYLRFEHTAGGPFTLEVAKLLAGGDPRFGLPPKEEMLRRNVDEVKAWVLPEFSRGALEIALVGDLDLEATIDAVARTLGALPKRDPRPELAEARRVRFPATPFDREFVIPTEIPKGNLALYWPTTDGRDIRRNRRLNLLGEILSDRLRIRIREELGDAYSPGAGSNASDVYPDYGYIQAGVTIDPPRARRVADIVVQIAAELAAGGTTEDELARCKQPILTSLRDSARTNQYWIGAVLARAQERPEVLDWCRNRYTDNESIAVADIDALAKAYLSADRASRVIVIPKPKPAE